MLFLKLVMRTVENHRLWMRLFLVLSTLCLLFLSFFVSNGYALTVKDALQNTTTIVYPQPCLPVDQTVADALHDNIIPGAKLITVYKMTDIPKTNTVKVSVMSEKFSGKPKVNSEQWLYFVLNEDGNGELLTSHSHLLFALYCLLNEEWLEKDITEFKNGKVIVPQFNWITGRDASFGWRKRFTRNYNPEQSVREFARMGCSHVIVNCLSQPFPLTIHPAGEHYYRYYVSGPDFDQFVETELNKGIYPPEYLSANLAIMKENAQLAIKYGLNPGMHVANPRSVPEELFERYPFLRGPRIDHPYRAYEPRYALTTTHPVVRWHYAKMLTKIMTEIPEMSFISTWLNDSGSGFEHTTTLYAGRNGGPYLIREWKTHEEIANAAADNIVRYYEVLRDAARKINPEFRIIAGIRAIPEEADLIMNGINNGIDTHVSVSSVNDKTKWEKLQSLRARGSFLHSNVDSRINAAVIGTPFPWLVYKRLQQHIDNHLDKIQATFDAPSLAPYDINRTVIKAFQLATSNDIDRIIKDQAEQWVGKEHRDILVLAWQYCDQAVEKFPGVPLYDSYGFIPNRLWVRPFVPDINKIPEQERAYYEKYILSAFNNPHNIDLNADMLWEVLPPEKARQVMAVCDREVLPPLQKAVQQAETGVKETQEQTVSNAVFVDLRDRLHATMCFYRTLRNASAWIGGIHGYLNSSDDNEKERCLGIVYDMIDNELENCRMLLQLWEQGTVNFMPIFQYGETWFMYGDNFGELVRKKIELMEKYKDHVPNIDPDYRWRMPEHFPVSKDVYLKY